MLDKYKEMISPAIDFAVGYTVGSILMFVFMFMFNIPFGASFVLTVAFVAFLMVCQEALRKKGSDDVQ